MPRVMHHRMFLTACLVGVASLAAAATFTSTSTAEDATTTSKQALLEQIATIEDELKQFTLSHTADDEYATFRKLAAEKTAGPLKYINELGFNDVFDFKHEVKRIKDVDVAVIVTALPSRIQSYAEFYYAGITSIVDKARAAAETPATKTPQKSVSGDEETKATTGKTSTITSTSPKTVPESVSLSPTAGNSTIGNSTTIGSSTTAAPIPSTTLSTTSANTTSTTSISSSTSLPNAASKATGMLKAAGAVAIGLAGLVFLL